MTTMTTMPRARGGAAVLGLLLVGGGLATAATPQAERAGQIELEISERAPGKPDVSMRFLVGIIELNHSEITAQAGPARYRVKLLFDPQRGSGPALFCELERFEGGARGGYDARLKLSSPVRRGVRLTLGRVIRPDGSRLEVLATVK